MVYVRPTHQGAPIIFGVSGQLWRDALVMYDRETGSLWSHVTGGAIVGPLKGQTLTPYPASHTTWKQWRRLHPDTLVLSKQSAFGVEGTHNAYRRYFEDQEKLGIFGTRNPDAVLPGKEFVLGLSLGDTRVAYPYRDLNRQPLVQDMVNGEPILVAFSAKEATAVAFSRRVGERVLEFANLREADGDLVMEDRQTGSTWQVLTGTAIKGQLTGSRLRQLPATRAFWFAWKGFYSQTRLWRASPHLPSHFQP
ncbi:MAG: hypothetical protein C3F12_08390 [Candidatus Methylomirabilota bacterium]|nr:MAG: hypothetical protein C3F12_08390 [candidate division NC10 bacterium]